MHILIMTFNKLNNDHISVFGSDNACLKYYEDFMYVVKVNDSF